MAPFEPPTFGTITNLGVNESKRPIKQKTPQEECEEKGGFWDAATQSCVLVKPQEEKQKPVDQPKIPLQSPEAFVNEKGRASGVSLPDGRSFLNLSPEEVAQAANTNQPINQVGTQANKIEAIRQAQQLQGQVGQINPLGINPTGLDFGEAATTGIISAIPRALGYAVTGAGAGLAGGATVGSVVPGAGTVAGAGAGAVIGAAAGFVSGIASAMIGNFKKQRTDSVNAQKRVLDEGKQNLQDWATLAGQDPANRQVYIKNFNQQLALIDQAYRQMKLDTSRDVAKFETALPDLAEFEAFYATQGERDYLIRDMQNNLLQVQPEDYKFLELAQRRVGLDDSRRDQNP